MSAAGFCNLLLEVNCKNQYKPFLTTTAKFNMKKHIEMLLDICSQQLLFLQLTTKPLSWPNMKITCSQHQKMLQLQSAVDVYVTNMKTPCVVYSSGVDLSGTSARTAGMVVVIFQLSSVWVKV